MDGLEVAPEQYRGARRYTSGPQVAPDTEKEVTKDTGYLYYVSGPERTNPGSLEDGSLKIKAPKEPKKICGVASKTFWLLVVVALLVIGGAISGGVGGWLANKKTTAELRKPDLDTTSTTSTEPRSSTTATESSSTTSTEPESSTTTTATASSSTTTTASTTSSAPVTSGTIGVAENPCPGRNLTTETGSDGSIFTLLCAVDWPSGVESAYGNGTVKDLSALPATEYTLKSCIAQCVQWNQDTSNDPQCKGVVYSANLTASFDGGQGGNCFLKSGVGRYYPNSNTSMAAGLLGG